MRVVGRTRRVADSSQPEAKREKRSLLWICLFSVREDTELRLHKYDEYSRLLVAVRKTEMVSSDSASRAQAQTEICATLRT